MSNSRTKVLNIYEYTLNPNNWASFGTAASYIANKSKLSLLKFSKPCCAYSVIL